MGPHHARQAGSMIAKRLERSSFVELPGLGHGVVRLDNPLRAVTVPGVFADPTQRLDTTCVDQLPEPVWS